MLGSTQCRRPPHATGLSLGERLGSERTGPTDADIVEGADQRGVHNRIVLWWTAQPNGLRLSCGAELKGSQTQFYCTVRQDETAPRGCGAPSASGAG
jgi:hypothetical protein